MQPFQNVNMPCGKKKYWEIDMLIYFIRPKKDLKSRKIETSTYLDFSKHHFPFQIYKY